MDAQQIEEAGRATNLAIRKFPGLTSYGITDTPSAPDQAALFGRHSLMATYMAMEWFSWQLADPRRYWIEKSVRHPLSSYTYKSAIEGRYARYVSNGNVISAAVGLGLRMCIDPGHSNPLIRLIVDTPKQDRLAA